MSMLVDILNAIAILLFLYPFAIYPGLLYVLARRKSKDASADAAQESLPSLALVICALNEEKIIRQKMENCLALRYPQGKLRIVVISDGSTDATAAIVREYQDKGIELIDQPRRRGKIANLNAVLPARTEDILALSDANVLYAPDALLHLAERFEDPTVGCVSGRVILTGSAPELDQPTSSYYSVEWLLQEQASSIYAMAGADGAMYALRRQLFRRCPDDTIVEDFIIPMSVIRQGMRTVFRACGDWLGTRACELGRRVSPQSENRGRLYARAAARQRLAHRRAAALLVHFSFA